MKNKIMLGVIGNGMSFLSKKLLLNDYMKNEKANKVENVTGIFGISGSGKTCYTQLEMINCFKNSEDDIYVIEADYPSYRQVICRMKGKEVPLSENEIKEGYVSECTGSSEGREITYFYFTFPIWKQGMTELFCKAFKDLWNKISENSRNKWICIENADILLSNEETSEMFYNILSKAEEHNCKIIFTSKFVETFINNEFGEKILLDKNNELIMLQQRLSDKEKIKEIKLDISNDIFFNKYEKVRSFINSVD